MKIKLLLLTSLFFLNNFICYSQWINSLGSSYNFAFDKEGNSLITAPWNEPSPVYKSVDDGLTWTALGNLVSNTNCPPSPWALSVQGNNIYVGDINGGCPIPVYNSNNNGATWTSNYTLPVLGTIFSMESNSNYLFIGMDSDLYRSDDHGNSWLELTNGLPTNINVKSIVLVNNDLYICAPSYGIYKSTDNGNSWNVINNGISTLNIIKLVADGNNLFAIAYDNLFVSNNNGASWSSVNTAGIPNNANKSIAVSGDNYFIGIGVATNGPGVYHSSNAGVSWTQMNSGLTNLNINALFLSGNNLLAGTDQGTFVYPFAICPSSYNTISVSACNSYTAPSGNNTWSSSGTYVDSLLNSNGCDSVLTIILTIGSPTVVVSYTGAKSFCLGDSVILDATQMLSGYQWYNSNYQIPNATGTTYAAKAAGNYYCVAFDSLGCTDTSNTIIVSVPCFPIGPDVERENLFNESVAPHIKFYPNPGNGIFTIESPPGLLQIFNTLNKNIYSKEVLNNVNSIDISEFPDGIYMIHFKTQNSTVVKKLIISKF